MEKHQNGTNKEWKVLNELTKLEDLFETAGNAEKGITGWAKKQKEKVIAFKENYQNDNFDFDDFLDNMYNQVMKRKKNKQLSAEKFCDFMMELDCLQVLFEDN